MTYVVDKNIEDVYTTEKQKNSFEYLRKVIDHSIAKLVYEKDNVRKMRNLYEGVRDEEEFRYLQETFGIETPLALKMTPLIKTRVDVLLGSLFPCRASLLSKPTLLLPHFLQPHPNSHPYPFYGVAKLCV